MRSSGDGTTESAKAGQVDDARLERTYLPAMAKLGGTHRTMIGDDLVAAVRAGATTASPVVRTTAVYAWCEKHRIDWGEHDVTRRGRFCERADHEESQAGGRLQKWKQRGGRAIGWSLSARVDRDADGRARAWATAHDWEPVP